MKHPSATSLVMAARDSYIILNVGGICYTTSLKTLISCPDSMLGKMFGEGGVPPQPDSNGHFFIDRDGTMFRFILNFMRNKRLCLPSSFEEFDQLLAEADFFQLNDLKVKIASKVSPQPAQMIAKKSCGKEVILLRKGLTFSVRVQTRISYPGGSSWAYTPGPKQQFVCVLEAKRETWGKLKSLASASLSTIPPSDVERDSKVSTCRGMESKIYPIESCPSVLATLIQDGFQLENTVTIGSTEYLVFTNM